MRTESHLSAVSASALLKQFDPAVSIQEIITNNPPKHDVKHLLQWFIPTRALKDEFPRVDITLTFHRPESGAAFCLTVGWPTQVSTWKKNAAAVIFGLIAHYAARNGYEI